VSFDWDGDIENVSHKLSDAQVVRLLAMTEVLRDEVNLCQITEIKSMLRADDIQAALGYWSEFTEAEQIALWVAPTYGGIFTTEERTKLKTTEGS
jgi:hypothetical protein